MKRLLCILVLGALLAGLLIPAAAALRPQTGNVFLAPEPEKKPPEPLAETQPDFDPVWPVDESFFVSCVYYYQTGRTHSTRYGYTNSLDISGDGHALAVEAGVIETVDYLYNSFGNFVVILHDNGGRSLYAHLARANVSEGDRVEKGQVIGVVGNTGRSGATHLHYEYSLGDPWLNFFKDKYADKIEYEQNCYYNNKAYNEDPYIAQWIGEHYVQIEDTFYWNKDPIPQYSIDTRYGGPFRAAVAGTKPQELYNWIDGNPVGTVPPGTRCVVEKVYDNGWCRVLLLWEEAKMGYIMAYAPLSHFLDPAYIPMNHILGRETPAALKPGASRDGPVLPEGSLCVETGFRDGMAQVIAQQKPNVRQLLWVEPTSDLIEGVHIGSNFSAAMEFSATEALCPTEDGLAVTDPTSAQNMVWIFHCQEDGTYTITSPLDGMALHALSDQSIGLGPEENATRWILSGTDSREVWLSPAGSDRILHVMEDHTVCLCPRGSGEATPFSLDSELRYDLCYDGNGASPCRAVVPDIAYQDSVEVKEPDPQPVSYTLRFDPAGGTLAESQKTLTPVFLGWNTRQDGSGSSYGFGDQVPILGETTLYAQWSPLEMGQMPEPRRENYVFDGWYTEPQGGVKMIASSHMTHGMTLYARWSQPGSGGHVLLWILLGAGLLIALLIVLYFIQKARARKRRNARRRTHAS